MKYVIIGSSAAGIQAAEELRKIDQEGLIQVISAEDFPPYSRCLLSRFVDGRLTENNLYFKTRHFFSDYNIEAALGVKISSIDRKAKKAVSSEGREFSYDKLLIATGSYPVFPKINGLNLAGVHSFHSLNDGLKLLEKIKGSKHAVVAGAGFVGLEAAYALVKRGLKVTVIERCSQILPHQLDVTASSIIQKDLEALGVKIILDESLISINGDTSVHSITTADKSQVQADVVVIATGMRPNKDFAQNSGIESERGILVDEFLRTSDPSIYAAGDVIEIMDVSTGQRAASATWFNAVLQGKFSAYNMAGLRQRYSGGVGIQNAVQFHQIPAISYGKTQVDAENETDFEVISIHKDKVYKKLVLNADKICGMIFVGDILKSGFYAALIREEVNVAQYKDKLLDTDFNYAYFKEFDFGQYNPYQGVASCWVSPQWWQHRVECMGIRH